ncbi:LPXTG cell wall anchor domain-containing protein [Dactylosporangium sp. CA-233914]|uniref:LPXTG cell wall anchor domain-containing protein n=1 Tax=Dactylosporangium sp. CA-233914 TaxID=3239934 RepID=UPI003D92681F
MSRRITALAAVLTLTAAVAACGSSSAQKVPYTDDRSTGGIVLYGADGKARTSGKLGDKPFVAKAVSRVAAPSPYDGDGRKATLLAYQPREGVSPQLWTGTFLTGATAYADPAHPTVEAPAGGLSMGEFIQQYPTRWNGLVQLRIYLGVPNEPTQNDKYVSADIKINGDTWTLLGAKSDLAAPMMLTAPRRDDGVPILVSVSGSPEPTTSTTTPGGGGGDLPKTGLNILLIAGVGVGLVALGSAALVAARRRKVGAGARS